MRNNTNLGGIDMSRNDILLVMIVSTIVIFAAYMVADMVYGELLTIEGSNEEYHIFLAIESDLHYLQWNTPEGYSEHFDLKIRSFNSGGFRISDSSILVFGHPVNSGYDLVIKTTEGIQRIHTDMTVQEKISTTVEPKNSVGADISRHDVPSDLTRPELDVKGLDMMYLKMNKLYSKQIGDTLDINLDLKVPGQSYGGIEGADIHMKVVREGFTIYETSGTTDKHGKWNIAPVIEWPIFWPIFCYDVIITAEKDGYTTDIDDDFVILDQSSSKGLYLEESYDWLLDKKPTDKDRECNK